MIFRPSFIRFLCICVLCLLPVSTFATSLALPFGGFATKIVPCTCSGGIWVQYELLYLGGNKFIPGGALTYRPVPTGPSIPYAHGLAGIPGIWYLGDYFPITNTCLILVPTGLFGLLTSCVPLPDLGVMFRVGTSRPAFLGF